MKTLTLQAEKDHVQSLAMRNHPEKALVELVWNSIDAEADNIEIVIERSESGAIEKVLVKDDGHGFNRNEVESDFGKIGGSWKASSAQTLNGKRTLHGRKGKGRLRGFALGSEIYWESTAESVEQSEERRVEKTTISSTLNRPEIVSTSTAEVLENGTRSGTIFTARNTDQWQLTALDNGVAKEELLMNFAPILLKEPQLRISFDGETLNAEANILENYTDTFSYGERNEKTGQLRVIQWRNGDAETILFGPDEDHFISEISGREFRAGFKFTAYVISPEVTVENSADLTIGNMVDSALNELWTAFKERFTEYAVQVSRTKRKNKIENWKSQGAYPYRHAPRASSERAERAAFDLVATTISDHIPKDGQKAKLTLQLLKTAIQNEPDALGRILTEVINLSEDDRATLSTLLQETTLPAIIASANKVAQRSKFLAALRKMLFDPQDMKLVKERDHLHKILENELWVFGEKYSVMRSEKSLTDLLRVHLKLSGLDDSGVRPIKRWDGKSGRTDLHLAVQDKQFGCTRHLIVELKAPGVTATRTELNQLEDYANAIAGENAFSRTNSTWDLILVVTDFDSVVKNRLGNNNELGFLQEIQNFGQPFVRTYIRRWADVLEENWQRLAFYSDSLEHDPSAEEGMEYVQTHYSDYLPTELKLGSKNAV